MPASGIGPLEKLLQVSRQGLAGCTDHQELRRVSNGFVSNEWEDALVEGITVDCRVPKCDDRQAVTVL